MPAVAVHLFLPFGLLKAGVDGGAENWVADKTQTAKWGKEGRTRARARDWERE